MNKQVHHYWRVVAVIVTMTMALVAPVAAGEWMVFRAGNETNIVPKLPQLETATYATLSEDGERIFFATGNPEPGFYVLKAPFDGAEPKTLLEPIRTDLKLDWDIAESPDGGGVAILRSVSMSEYGWHGRTRVEVHAAESELHNLNLLGVDGGGPGVVVIKDLGQRPTYWNPAHDRLLAYDHIGAKALIARGDVVSEVSKNSGARVVEVNRGYVSTASRHGKYVIFHDGREGEVEYTLVEIDGRFRRVLLTPQEADSKSYATRGHVAAQFHGSMLGQAKIGGVRADGKRSVAMSIEHVGSPALWQEQFDIDGKAPLPAPVWSRGRGDRTAIAYCVYGPDSIQIAVVTLQNRGGATKDVFELPREKMPVGAIAGIAWSPDGAKLLWQLKDESVTELAVPFRESSARE